MAKVDESFEEIRARNELYVQFLKEEDLVKKFNLFLQIFCKEDFAHLIDSDENAGERMREAIKKQKDEAYEQGYSDCQDTYGDGPSS